MAKSKTLNSVLVTTKHRGVFFGQIKDDSNTPAEITLLGAKNCIYWSADVKGFLGLAATGPNKSCRIGATVPEITLYEITSVTPVTDAARDAWEKA